ncbi:acetyltransferase, GNAT family protein [Pseudooceanicola batsensis HTCC2597]|uniref:Acetyltransferase, GNAT family protein n=1 Tax=Pseudooceanicola batsensis (strain ATCC BAA-863 / DSM 15984 / KCTC 12145 / HTCC2597) TaxID=252305 RepID=A3TVV3_PSEBH|nr:GNAT family N-acetyltransferase [Pseudooceanicola batsensis]EAQ03749.1 acetyltransferase, GNAT family protein [Pseudooceanicola batsensis HTCC2597]
MPELEAHFAAAEATWPPAETVACGPFMLRRSPGGGKRVTAATARGAVASTDILAAEAQMREMGQVPLFSLRPGDAALDDMLAAQGYAIVDPTDVMTIPVNELTGLPTDPEQASLAVWEPLAIQLEFWAEGGVGADRIAVMERAECAKTALIGRHENSPGGTCFVGVSGGIGMMHALEIVPAARRAGMGRAMTIQAAQWAAQQGAEQFSVLCVQSNEAASALYARLGLATIGQYHYRIKES